MIHVNSKRIRGLKGIFTPHRFKKFLHAFSEVPITLLFFYKFVLLANNSKSCPPTKWPRQQKCSPWKVFETNKPPSNPATFEQERPLEARTWDCLNITLDQKWHSAIFQISAEKSFLAWQKGSCTFLYNFGGCNLQKPWPFNKCRKFLLSSLETFFCRNLENVGMSFLGRLMLRKSHVWVSRASPAQKSQGLRVVRSKNLSRATFFVFLVT